MRLFSHGIPVHQGDRPAVGIADVEDRAVPALVAGVQAAGVHLAAVRVPYQAVAQAQALVGEKVDVTGHFRAGLVQHRVPRVQAYPAITQVEDLAQAGVQVLAAILLADVAGGQAQGYLVGIVEPVAPGEARLPEQLVVAEGELGAVEIGLGRLVVVLADQVVDPRLQGLQQVPPRQLGGALEEQTAVEAEQSRPGRGAVAAEQAAVVQFVFQVAVLGGGLEEAVLPQHRQGGAALHVQALAGDAF